MKQRLRFLAALLLAGLLLVGLAACGDSGTASAVLTEAAASSAASEEDTGSESEPAESAPSEALPASEAASETAAASEQSSDSAPDAGTVSEELLDPDGTYTTKEDVALYLYTYGELPSNFITKKQAQALGWTGGSLEPYAPGKCIGGDRFGNYEGLLPEGRTYHECDINTLGASSRGAERLVFSDDGLIYYTGDHYETFTLLYGEE